MEILLKIASINFMIGLAYFFCRSKPSKVGMGVLATFVNVILFKHFIYSELNTAYELNKLLKEETTIGTINKIIKYYLFTNPINLIEILTIGFAAIFFGHHYGRLLDAATSTPFLEKFKFYIFSIAFAVIVFSAEFLLNQISTVNFQGGGLSIELNLKRATHSLIAVPEATSLHQESSRLALLKLVDRLRNEQDYLEWKLIHDSDADKKSTELALKQLVEFRKFYTDYIYQYVLAVLYLENQGHSKPFVMEFFANISIYLKCLQTKNNSCERPIQFASSVWKNLIDQKIKTAIENYPDNKVHDANGTARHFNYEFDNYLYLVQSYLNVASGDIDIALQVLSKIDPNKDPTVNMYSALWFADAISTTDKTDFSIDTFTDYINKSIESVQSRLDFINANEKNEDKKIKSYKNSLNQRLIAIYNIRAASYTNFFLGNPKKIHQYFDTFIKSYHTLNEACKQEEKKSANNIQYTQDARDTLAMQIATIKAHEYSTQKISLAEFRLTVKNSIDALEIFLLDLHKQQYSQARKASDIPENDYKNREFGETFTNKIDKKVKERSIKLVQRHIVVLQTSIK